MTRSLSLLFLSLGLLLTACGSDASPPMTGSQTASVPPPVEPAGEPAAAEPIDEPPAAKPAPSAGGDIDGDAAAGATVYKGNCIACHQADGTGMGGALGADFVNDATRKAKSDADLVRSVTNGVPGTAMISWSGQLDETQIRDVVAYIRSEFMN